MSEQGKRRRECFMAAALVLALLLGCLLLYRPVMDAVRAPDALRAWVAEHRAVGRAAMVALMAVQVVLAFLPGEPVEIAAGYAFGALEGLLLCLIGASLGCALAAGAARGFGRGAVERFFPPERIEELPFMRSRARQTATIFLLYLIPGTPKDLFNYAIGLTRLPLPRTIALTAVARIPSIVTSTIGGSALGARRMALALGVMVLTGALSLAGLLVYRAMCRRDGR